MSAVSAPADFIACRIASRSCGVAPSALSALTTSASRVPAGMLTMEPACDEIAMSVLSVTTVWPPELGAGWLTCGLALIVTDRLPWATAHGASVTAWFITIAQQSGSLVQMAPGAKLGDVVKALNSLGATPQDLLAILQALKSAGAMAAELEVI